MVSGSWASKIACFLGEPGGNPGPTGGFSCPIEYLRGCREKRLIKSCRRSNLLTRTPGLSLALDEEFQAADCFSELARGYTQGVFFPPVWPIRTRHGPYNSVSGEKHLEKGLVWSKNAGKSSHQHKQKQKTQPKRPANPPARFAFRHKANSEATKNGAGPKQEPNQTT